MERRFGRTTVSVQQGDITRLQVDAIVNAANTHLWMGGGVAGAIKRAGGAEIEQEAVALGPIGMGEAVVTGAGRLPCRHVIHAATMGQDLTTSAAAIRSATRSSLRADEAAQLMIEETVACLRGESTLKTIIFVGFNAEAAEAFGRALEEA